MKSKPHDPCNLLFELNSRLTVCINERLRAPGTKCQERLEKSFGSMSYEGGGVPKQGPKSLRADGFFGVFGFPLRGVLLRLCCSSGQSSFT